LRTFERTPLLPALGAGLLAAWIVLAPARSSELRKPEHAPLPVATSAPVPLLQEPGAPAAALEARCALAMVQGVCRVMKPGDAAQPQTRVFVAGAGEVDSRVYAELRRQGDEMCAAVRRHCEQDWDGTACRIARALYPEAPS
jgi:hypothetical protein